MSASVLGVRFDAVTVDQAADRALALLAAKKDAYICTPNPEIVWRCRKNERWPTPSPGRTARWRTA